MSYKFYKYLILWLLVILLVVLSSGCESDSDIAIDLAEEANVQRCIDMGGLPVRSIWDGRLTECIFKPLKN